MSAEKLREAAALMRSRAEAATRGPWKAKPYEAHPNGTLSLYSAAGGGWLIRPSQHGGFFNHEPDAEHIASWHPEVARAVAAVLLHEAAIEEQYGASASTLALAIAQVYLGEHDSLSSLPGHDASAASTSPCTGEPAKPYTPAGQGNPTEDVSA